MCFEMTYNVIVIYPNLSEIEAKSSRIFEQVQTSYKGKTSDKAVKIDCLQLHVRAWKI
jgi:hypothetical protein